VEFLIVLAVLLVVAWVVTGPLRREWRSRGSAAHPATDSDAAREAAELEAARDAKYREIRDAELDHRTGKLSDADYQAIDAALRAEAVEILHQLDQVRGSADVAAPGDRQAEPPAH
jgi:flagellar biosynthesis/type III secretory pathway M-ring protein FliF/YscJ